MPINNSPTAEVTLEVRQAIEELLVVSQPAHERRIEDRHAFVRPVSITYCGDSVHQFDALSRDISPSGIGLIHLMPLYEGEVIVSISARAGEMLNLRTEILWCDPCADGWFLSGGRFLSLAEHA